MYKTAMASSSLLLVLVVASLLVAEYASAEEVVCEKLPQEHCAFAVSSTARRCVLERSPLNAAYMCRTSDVVVEHRLSNWIETDECVNACGIDRSAVGISSDSLLDEGFTRKLCSTDCYQSCNNVVDLYFNLAAGEGVFLHDLCKARGEGTHRSMVEILSSGAAAIPASLAAASSPSPVP